MEAVPKIEGHAAFYAHLRAGRVDKAQMIGLENDRFVEKILLGRKYYEAPIITSRICGICPTIHNVTATKGIEAASGIRPTEQTEKLRKLMLCGQMIQSHSLHLYLLVLPDFYGLSSSFELQKNHPQVFKKAILLKQYADLILDTIGGRAVHPIANVPGGFKSFPTKDELKTLYEKSKEIIEIARETVLLFKSFTYPKISQKVIYSALQNYKNYSFYDGDVVNSKGQEFPAKNYRHYLNEELRPYTRAKFVTIKGHEVMVGAMARMNLGSHQMGKEVEKLISELEIREDFDNPFDNIIAQAIENYYFVVESNKLVKYFINNGIDKKEPVKLPKEFSKGVGACEAPRGTLFHYYELNKEGYITNCDIITPTVQNLPSMELGMKNLGPIIKDLDKKERDKTIEMLIRAFDPCITCATH
ncbi:MAG: Ni/Fe hydrogenase subunit alpha [Patescibacteria group bacterium]|nr:Ni/Fe hydrogenase subunit alpha [Patescibacteria group bacterium]